MQASTGSTVEFYSQKINFKSQARRQIMSTKQSSIVADRAIVIHRVIPASTFRRLRTDFTHQKKAKKALRRMRKEGNDE